MCIRDRKWAYCKYVNATDENGNRYVSVWRRMTELIPAEPPVEDADNTPLDNQSGGEPSTDSDGEDARVEDITPSAKPQSQSQFY